MKNRPTRIARTADRRRRSFAFHPLSFAICLGFSGAALAAPQGGTVVAGQATITQPTPTSQVINQTTNKAIIDWKSFSIASGEKVRFNQPSTTSVTLNRVTGYDPSYILGEMSSNGKIFLVNPYGVVFGAGARVDVGGLVASTPVDRQQRLPRQPLQPHLGRARRARRSAARCATKARSRRPAAWWSWPGRASATPARSSPTADGSAWSRRTPSRSTSRATACCSSRPAPPRRRTGSQQLGRIQADGGSIEMRAAARGAFADTVLNMTGIVQAKTIGSREGRIVIDGGGEGIVAVVRQDRRHRPGRRRARRQRHASKASACCSTTAASSTRRAAPAAARSGSAAISTARIRTSATPKRPSSLPGAVAARRRGRRRATAARSRSGPTADPLLRQHHAHAAASTAATAASSRSRASRSLAYDGKVDDPRAEGQDRHAACSTRPTSSSSRPR